MLDTQWLTRAVAALVTVLAAPGGFAALEAINGPATASEWAVRGASFDIGPHATTPYGLPVADAAGASWGRTHATYPATDIFVGCGATLISPVNGTVLEVRKIDSYDPAIDNPATRGGRSVAIQGDDGVRYYLAHFERIDDGLDVGDRVALGDRLGTMGDTGRASACHLHFAISPPCPGKEWRVRRGSVWPHPYLDAWRRGEQTSPVDEVDEWFTANPDACQIAMADPFAGDA